MHARLGYTTMTGSPRRIVPPRTTEAYTPTFTWWCFAAVRRIPSEKRPRSPRPVGPSRRRWAGRANYMGEPTAALWTLQFEEIQFNRRISLTRIEAPTCLRGVTNSAPTIAVHRAVLRLSPQGGATSAGEGRVRQTTALGVNSSRDFRRRRSRSKMPTTVAAAAMAVPAITRRETSNPPGNGPEGARVISNPASPWSNIARISRQFDVWAVMMRIQNRSCGSLTTRASRWRMGRSPYARENVTAAWPDTLKP